MNKIEGLIAASFTPMKIDRSINLALIPELYESFKQNNIGGVFINGSTSEGLSLTTKERMKVTEAWSNAISDDFKLLVHVGHAALQDARVLAEHAALCSSVSGISTVGPFYQKPNSVSELVDFCKEIAKSASEIPFYYYHIPEITGVDFPMIDFLKRASDEIPTLAGIKFSNHDFIDYSQCRQYANEHYDLMFGTDELLSCGLMLGAKGFIGSTYNLFPHLYHQIIDAFEQNDIGQVQQLQRKSMEYVRIIGHYGFGGAAKGVMKLLDLDCGPARLPFQTINKKQLNQLENELTNKGFFEYTLKTE